MTTADRLILEIDAAWPTESKPVSKATLERARAAVAECPGSPKLRCMLADLLVADAPSATFHDIEEAAEQLHQALAMDSRCFEALEGLGYIHDVFYDAFDAAVDCFQRALAIFESPDSVYGLARALAQNGQANGAVDLLRTTLHRDSPRIIELRIEIEAGEWGP